MDLFNSLKFKIIRRKIKVAFPEATDARILGAAARLRAEELVEPILIGNVNEVEKAANARGIALG
ncbi:phosphate acetyltransferase, partial [Alistipes putredinis]|nr:phosphate acetyltransferase [Alistipes putredinis]